MDLEASFLELRRHISRRGLTQKVHLELEGSLIIIRLLEESRTIYVGYRAGDGNFLVSDPGQQPTSFFQLDPTSIGSLLPAASSASPRGRAAERLKDHVLFVSYARRDEAIVTPLVALLRLADTEVFRDGDSIRPGDPWRKAIRDAIESCTEFLLFWCAHSAVSKEVDQEYNLALRLNKRVVPVLLDRTELNGVLSQRQFIDMRQFHQHDAEVAGDGKGSVQGEPQVGTQDSYLILREDASLYLTEELGRVLESNGENGEN